MATSPKSANLEARIRKFAEWFRRSSGALKQMDPADAVEEIHTQLTVVDSGLGLEVSGDEPVWELVLSAGGDAARFDLVAEICREMGEIQGWQIQALKPARGFDFTFQTSGVELCVSELKFDPLKAGNSPGELGIVVLAPADARLTVDDAWSIVEHGIGERCAACIQLLRVGVLPPDHQELLAIAELEDYVNWHVARRKQHES